MQAGRRQGASFSMLPIILLLAQEPYSTRHSAVFHPEKKAGIVSQWLYLDRRQLKSLSLDTMIRVTQSRQEMCGAFANELNPYKPT